MPRSGERTSSKIYKRLYEIDAGFEHVRRGLVELRHVSAFNRDELARFKALSAETRAAVLSYLASVVETLETDEAGRLSRRRRAREREQENANS